MTKTYFKWDFINFRLIRQLLSLIITTAVCLISAGNVFPQELEESLNGHVFYGTMNISNDDPYSENEDFDILIFGADAQKPLVKGAFRYGFETGFLFSIDSDVRNFYASSGEDGAKAAVSVDVNSLMIDYFAGGFISFEPAKWFRISFGAGPLIIWSLWETESEETNSEDVTSQSDSDFGVGVYARAGIDLFFTKKVGLNIGARVNETTLNLKSSQGEVDVEGWQYYFGIAFRF